MKLTASMMNKSKSVLALTAFLSITLLTSCNKSTGLKQTSETTNTAPAWVIGTWEGQTPLGRMKLHIDNSSIAEIYETEDIDNLDITKGSFVCVNNKIYAEYNGPEWVATVYRLDEKEQRIYIDDSVYLKKE